MGSDVRELLNTLREVEKKLIAVNDVRIGMIYLTWGIALAGFAILQSVMMGIIPDSATITYVSITYWAAVTALGAVASLRLERIMQAFISKHDTLRPRASRLVRLTSIANSIAATSAGLALLSIPSGLIASVSYTAAWDFTVASVTMIYLLVSMHHFRRSVHMLY